MGLKDLTIIGLGPGQLDNLTCGALERLKSADRVLLRTGIHPVAEELAAMGVLFKTCDELYERFDDFDKVYEEIAEAVLEECRRGPAVFAVPGHPLVGEEAVARIISKAAEAGITYEVLPAMSFLDPVLAVLGVDITTGLRLIDALILAGEKYSRESRPDPAVCNLVMQVYSPLVASEVKLSLMEFYPDEHPVKVIRAAGVPGQERVAEIPLYELDRLDWIDHLTSVFIPPCKEARPMVSRFPMDRLVDIMEQLRDDNNGCPWDREQTHESLKKYLTEETYEVVDAIDEGNMYKVCEELGDLLLQIAFHAQIARESGFFDMNDIVENISQKLIRRHPHIFGNVSVKSSAEVSVNWEEIKKGELREKGEIRRSLLDGIPRSMPSLLRADKIQRKAAKVGFDWPDYTGALDKVTEEVGETQDAIEHEDKDRIREELGDLLFAVVNLARLLDLSGEEALTRAVCKFKERFEYMENLAAKDNLDLKKMGLDELDRLWEEAKTLLKGK